METLIFDTSGCVYLGTNPAIPGGHVEWDDLTPFQQGYVRAAAEAEPLTGVRITAVMTGEDRSHTATMAKLRLRFSDLSPEALGRMMEDCEAFERATGDACAPGHGIWFWTERQKGGLVASGWGASPRSTSTSPTTARSTFGSAGNGLADPFPRPPLPSRC